MFRIRFVWVYIIKGFCPLIREKQTLVCEGFAVRGERFAPLFSLQASAGFVSVRFVKRFEKWIKRCPPKISLRLEMKPSILEFLNPINDDAQTELSLFLQNSSCKGFCPFYRLFSLKGCKVIVILYRIHTYIFQVRMFT